MIVLSTLYQTPRKSQAGDLRNIWVQASQVCHPPVLLRSRLHPPAARSAHRHKWDAVVLLVEVPNIWEPSGQVKRVPGPRSILPDKSHWSHPYALCDKAFTNVQERKSWASWAWISVTLQQSQLCASVDSSSPGFPRDWGMLHRLI